MTRNADTAAGPKLDHKALPKGLREIVPLIEKSAFFSLEIEQIAAMKSRFSAEHRHEQYNAASKEADRAFRNGDFAGYVKFCQTLGICFPFPRKRESKWPGNDAIDSRPMRRMAVWLPLHGRGFETNSGNRQPAVSCIKANLTLRVD